MRSRIIPTPTPVFRVCWLAACAVVAFVLAAVAFNAQAACNTAPIAVADAARAYDQPILIDVLGNDVAGNGGQALTVAVTGETCPGPVSVDFDLVTYTPSPPLLQGCQIHYTVTDEAGLSGSATVTVSVIAEIFVDGFESGDAAEWSSCDPSCP